MALHSSSTHHCKFKLTYFDRYRCCWLILLLKRIKEIAQTGSEY